MIRTFKRAGGVISTLLTDVGGGTDANANVVISTAVLAGPSVVAAAGSSPPFIAAAATNPLLI